MMNFCFCSIRRSTFFLPIARRKISASPSENQAKACTSCIICSWYTAIHCVCLRIASSDGCGYATFSLQCLRLMYVGIYASGPGRYNDTITIISSKVLGFSSLRYLRIPDDSNWNTQVVSQSANILNTFLSS